MKNTLVFVLAVTAFVVGMTSNSAQSGFSPVCAEEASAVHGGACVVSRKLWCANVPVPPAGCKRTEGQVTWAAGPKMEQTKTTPCTCDLPQEEGQQPPEDCHHVHRVQCNGQPFPYVEVEVEVVGTF